MRLTDLIEGMGTQVQAAKRIGVSQASVSGWLRGQYLPTPLAVRAIAAAAGLPVEEVAAMVDRARSERMGQVPCPEPSTEPAGVAQ